MSGHDVSGRPILEFAPAAVAAAKVDGSGWGAAGLAFDCAVHPDTTMAMGHDHTGMVTLGFPEPNADGLGASRSSPTGASQLARPTPHLNYREPNMTAAQHAAIFVVGSG